MLIVTAFHHNITRLQRGDYNRSSANPYVFVLKKDKAIRTLVKFGDSNADYTEIKEGLQPDDRVIISNLDDKMHFAEIMVKE
jgi:HlyD family secretion protein